MPVSLHYYILIVKCYSYVIIAPTVLEMVLNQFISVHFIPVKNKIHIHKHNLTEKSTRVKKEGVSLKLCVPVGVVKGPGGRGSGLQVLRLYPRYLAKLFSVCAWTLHLAPADGNHLSASLTVGHHHAQFILSCS